jgi:uncharacterized protein (TIGR02271 family)
LRLLLTAFNPSSIVHRATRQPRALKIAREELEVSKRKRETGRVQVKMHVNRREAVVDEPLLRSDARIERVDLNRYVARQPAVRREGDTVIFPVVEEVLHVEKRLLLKAELRVTRFSTSVRKPRRVQLRSTEPIVKRVRKGGRNANGAGQE